MKITKSHLRRLIKEEMSRVLKEADIDPLQKELMDAVNTMVNAYEGAELPPSIGELKAMIEAGQLLQAHHEITDKWNELILFHRKSGRELQHIVTKTFLAVNNLLKKVPDSIGGQRGQRTPQRPIDRDKDGNRIPVHEVKGTPAMKITKTHLARLIKEEMNKITEMRYAENKETGRWEEVAEGDEQQIQTRDQSPSSAREDIENAINMLENERDHQGTLFNIIGVLQDALAKL